MKILPLSSDFATYLSTPKASLISVSNFFLPLFVTLFVNLLTVFPRSQFLGGWNYFFLGSCTDEVLGRKQIKRYYGILTASKSRETQG